MSNTKTYLALLAFGVVAAAFTLQFRATQSLKSEVVRLRRDFSSATVQSRDDAGPSASARAGIRPPLPDEPNWHRRLAELEQTVNRLTRDAEYLMDRGQLPMATNKLHELIARFTDPALSDRERLRALGLLRRNRALTDNVVQHATSWLQTAQEERTRRELLQQLDGATNAALKQPLLNLAAKETSSDVRQEVVENLRNFIDDPQVENLLWSLLKNDPDEDVREEAEDALREGPLSPARLESLRQRALNAEAPIEERLVALRALSRARADVSEVVGIMAERAQRTTDSAERVRLFDAFDGLRNPALAPALVQGLQDPNPVVREKAADALSDFAKDPGVQQWLRHVSENDADQRVRREAFRALGKRLD